MSNDDFAIGVDLGATKIATALVARDGAVVAARHAPTLPDEGFEHVCQRIADEVAALLAGGRADEIRGVGIGSAGLVDGDAGVVRWAVNLGWKDVPLAAEVARRLDRALPVFADNDANANALGEGFFGSARGCRHYVLFTIGSGWSVKKDRAMATDVVSMTGPTGLFGPGLMRAFVCDGSASQKRSGL